ncbi:MAG: choice-of-anchor D domain-containing protein [Cyanobacteria bacterium J055]|nr:MAG: choice-of-anchor D domain-containing protein [Cyanobacteria bacterium J055]
MATLTVTSAADNGSGSLREAIANAQSGDTIKFASSLANQTITLQSQLEIPRGKDLTIDGADAANLTLSGGNTTRILLIQSASTDTTRTEVSIANLSLIDGKATPYGTDNLKQGGAILTEHQASLTLTNTTFKNNVADDGGGAIFSAFEGNLTVTGSRFEGNIATAGNNERAGGAIGFRGPNNFIVRDSQFIGNKGINGGALNSLNGKLTIENSSFINNDTTAGAFDPNDNNGFLRGYGGAIYTDRASTRDDSTSGTIRILNSVFDGNTGRGEGGAAYLYTGTQDNVIIDGSTFQNNEILELPNTTKGNGNGGAIVQISNGLNKGFTLSNTTFANNTAANQGGGVWMMDAPTTITNSTFSGNKTLTSTDPNDKNNSGGAMALYGPTDIINTTIANNHAGWVGGGIAGDKNVAVSVKNTIFYNNTADNGPNDWNIQQHTNRELIDAGNNLQFPAKQTTLNNDFNATANITIADPLLDILQLLNGALVHPLKAGSPAIDMAGAGAPGTDQRGLARQDGDANGSVIADIGAVEFQSGAPVNPVPEIEVLDGATSILDGSTTPLNFGSTPVGTNLTKTFVIKNSGTQDLNLSDLQLPAGFALVGTLPATVAPGGEVSVQITLDASAAGTPGGELVLTNSDADENPFNFAITGTVTDPGSGGGGGGTLPDPDCPCDTVVAPTLPTLDQLLAQLGSSRPQIAGTLADDVLWGDISDETIVGDGGNDSMAGAAGNDLIVGDDTAAAQTGADVLFGNTGSDTIFGGNGKDWAFGGKDPDLIYGDLDDDILYGDRGSDTIDGGGGNDIIIGGDPVFVETEADLMLGGAGSDSIFGNWGNDTSFGGDGDDWLFGGKDEDMLFGGIGNDNLFGDRGNDTICGGEGNDVILGGNGNPIPVGESLEQDFICAGAGNDFVSGNEGADRLNGDAGDDTLYGGKDNDAIEGGDGADILAGNQGDDTLSGGAGADRFDFAATDGTNIITDFEDGLDKIGLQGVTFDRLTIAQIGSDTQLTAGSLSVTLQGVASSAIDATDVVLV